MTPDQWEKRRERYAKIAERHENISNCTAALAGKFPPEHIPELEELFKSKGRDAIADFCAAFIESVVQGEITYEDIYGKSE